MQRILFLRSYLQLIRRAKLCIQKLSRALLLPHIIIHRQIRFDSSLSLPSIAIKSKMIVPLGDDITFMVRSMRYQGHPLRQYPLQIVPVLQTTFPGIVAVLRNLLLERFVRPET